MFIRVFWFLVYLSVLMWNKSTGSIMLEHGNVTVAGIFGIYDSCTDGGLDGNIDVSSVMLMEAVRWYFESLNTANALPVKIGFRGYVTCGSSNAAGEYAVDILTRSRCTNITKTASDVMIGVIGPEYSSETQVVSSIMGAQRADDRFLQIGMSSTATALNNRLLYPNFYRVIPDDTFQITTMVKLMQALDWNRIGIIYEDDIYGRNGAGRLNQTAIENGICVSQVYVIETNEYRSVTINQIDEMIRNIKIESKIEGIVFFGSRSVANIVLRVTEGLQDNDVPIFLLSESSSLQADVFKYSTGEVFDKLKGSLTVSPPYTEITTFTDHWNELFTNTTNLNEMAAINPYLYDVFKVYSSDGCDIRTHNCPVLTTSEINTVTPKQTVFAKYGIIAAHTMAKAFKSTYSKICGNSGCPTIEDFKDQFHPSLMLDAINGLSISFGEDFNVDVKPLSTEGFDAWFNDSVNMNLPVGSTDYEVYNFRRKPSSNTFDFIKVGNFTNNELLVDTSNIKDYIKDNNLEVSERNYPDVRKGQCPTGERCSECVPDNIPEVNMHILGDVYIIGICSINNRAIPGPRGCGDVRTVHGYQLLLAMQYGIKEFFNSRKFEHYKAMFGDMKIGLIVINSCNSPTQIARKILNHYEYGLLLGNGERLNLTNRIIGCVGGQATDVSLPAAEQLTELKLVQLSYSSTNPVLSDKEAYPYFMRIVPPDIVQARAMIELVKELDGKYIQVVHSEGAYGEGGRDSVIESAKELDICIAQVIEVKENTAYHGYYDIMRKKPHAKIVIIFLRSHVVTEFLRDFNEDAQNGNGDFQFLGSEAWAKNSDTLAYKIVQGALAVVLQMDSNEALDTFIQGNVPKKNETNYWLEEYFQKRQNCFFEWSFDKTFPDSCSSDNLPTNNPNFDIDPWCIFATNTVISLLKGSAVFFKNKCGSSSDGLLCASYVEHPEKLVEELKKVELNIYGTGNIKIYDDVGDGTMGYAIYNIQANSNDKSTRRFVKVGDFNTKTGLTINKGDIHFSTDAVIVSSCPNEQVCADCMGVTVSDIQKSDDVNVAVPVLGAVVGICILVIVGLVIIIIRKNKDTIHNADPNDSNSICTYDNTEGSISPGTLSSARQTQKNDFSEDNPYHEPCESGDSNNFTNPYLHCTSAHGVATSPSSASTTLPSAYSVSTSPSSANTTLPSAHSVSTSPSSANTTIPSAHSVSTSPSSANTTLPSAHSVATSPSSASTTLPSAHSVATSPNSANTTLPSAHSVATSPSSANTTLPSAHSVATSPSSANTTLPSAHSVATSPSSANTTLPSAHSVSTSPSSTNTTIPSSHEGGPSGSIVVTSDTL